MAIKVNIKKIVSFTLWCTLGAGVVVLLVAAIGYRNNTIRTKLPELNFAGTEQADEAP